MAFVQQGDGAIVIGQEVEAASYARAGFFPLEHVKHGGRRGQRRWQLAGELIGLHGRLTLALAQAIKAHMGGDAVQPTANGFGIAQRVASTIGAQKRLLGQIFGFREISLETEEVAIDPIVVLGDRVRRLGGKRTETTG